MESKNWHAWIDTMPPKPNKLYITGEVYIDTIGVKPQLAIREPQGINPDIIIVDLRLVPLQEKTDLINTWIPCRLEKILTSGHIMHKEVEIFYNDELLVGIDVEITS